MSRLLARRSERDSPMIVSERIRTAYHEAGHWVIGNVFGILQDRVTIRPNADRGTLGHVKSADVRVWPRDGEIQGEDIVCTYYAGFEAEVRISPETEAGARFQAEDDDERAERLLRKIDRATDADRERLRRRTAALVEEHWSAIERVAHELLERETLDFAEADTLCEIARGEATEDDLADYRRRRPPL